MVWPHKKYLGLYWFHMFLKYISHHHDHDHDHHHHLHHHHHHSHDHDQDHHHHLHHHYQEVYWREDTADSMDWEQSHRYKMWICFLKKLYVSRKKQLPSNTILIPSVWSRAGAGYKITGWDAGFSGNSTSWPYIGIQSNPHEFAATRKQSVQKFHRL